MFAAIIYSIRIESCFTSFDKIYLEIIEEVSTMTSFRISTGILSDTSMKTMKIADRMQDISREVGLVNRNLHGCFPEESIAALRLSDFSASLDVLSGKMHGFHRAMDDCAASYVNAEEQASNDFAGLSAGSAKNAGKAAGAAGAVSGAEGIFGSAVASNSVSPAYVSAAVGSAGTVLTASSYTKAEIGSSVSKKGRNKEAYIEAGVRTVAMFAFSRGDVYKTVENMREAHYARNEKNTDLPKTAEEAEAKGWKRCDASLYHQFDDRSREEIAADMAKDFPEGNRKYISGDGREVVYTPDGQQIVTDPRNMGTYNYVEVDSTEDIIGHLTLDVLPYWLWGNSANDSTPFTARVLGPLFK